MKKHLHEWLTDCRSKVDVSQSITDSLLSYYSLFLTVTSAFNSELEAHHLWNKKPLMVSHWMRELRIYSSKSVFMWPPFLSLMKYQWSVDIQGIYRGTAQCIQSSDRRMTEHLTLNSVKDKEVWVCGDLLIKGFIFAFTFFFNNSSRYSQAIDCEKRFVLSVNHFMAHHPHFHPLWIEV